MSRETPYLTSDPVTSHNKLIVCTMYLHVCYTGKSSHDLDHSLVSDVDTLPNKIDEAPPRYPLSSAVSSVSSPVSANFSPPMFNNELSEAEAAAGNKQVSAVAHI